MKKAYIFPGIGYHCDKPLLYYTKKLLKDYEIIEIQFKNLDFDIQVSEEKAFQQAKEQMKEVDSSTLFVSKSIGTYCAARLAKEYKIQKNELNLLIKHLHHTIDLFGWNEIHH